MRVIYRHNGALVIADVQEVRIVRKPIAVCSNCGERRRAPDATHSPHFCGADRLPGEPLLARGFFEEVPIDEACDFEVRLRCVHDERGSIFERVDVHEDWKLDEVEAELWSTGAGATALDLAFFAQGFP